ncbi:5-hydroxytryptamine receptor 3B [Apodemus speciosus]|uniref:5-hydroxytryptamine receptor 3B n=1 Tax=Apodemus speciosus TaxID=105296 RepID=A0ABQ0F4I6_APOSI
MILLWSCLLVACGVHTAGNITDLFLWIHDLLNASPVELGGDQRCVSDTPIATPVYTVSGLGDGSVGILGTATPQPGNSSLHRLTRQLLQQYHKEVRPVYNWTEATTVYLDLCIHAVLDVDVQNQKLKTSVWYREVWKDEFLSWNSSLFDEIQEISLPLSALWAPDIIINELIELQLLAFEHTAVCSATLVWSGGNAGKKLALLELLLQKTADFRVDVERSPDLPYVYVNSSGTIRNYKPIQVVSACSLQTYAFPFDIQNCSLTFNSILHTVEDVDLGFLRNREDIENDKRAFLNDSEWQLFSVSSTYRIRQSSAGDFAQIQFHGSNVPGEHFTTDHIPSSCPLAFSGSIFLMLVDLGSFYLPPNCRARIVFKTSVLVGYTVFRVNMSDEVPRSSGCTSLIGVFFTVCMALLVLSLSKSILLIKFLYEERHSGQARPLMCLRGDSDADDSRLYLRAPLAEATESPVCQEHQVRSDTLKDFWFQLQTINNSLRTQDQVYQKEVEWLAILYHFDQLLFRIYLAVLGLYTVTLCSLWTLWSRM